MTNCGLIKLERRTILPSNLLIKTCLVCKLSYFIKLRATSIASAQMRLIALQSFAAINSFGKRQLPIPTAKAPALNHDDRFSAVGSTPPVTIILLQGIGAIKPLINFGPSTSPGKTLHRSQPISCAIPTSVIEPQPGVYGMSLRLHTFATSGLKSGPTTKQAPA